VHRVERSDIYVLDHLWNGLDKLELYTRGRPASVVLSPLVRDAVEFVLGSLAAATVALSDGLRAKHPEVDWNGLREVRRSLVEDLGDLDAAGVAGYLERYLPPLRRAVQVELEGWSWSAV
jgi:uncharacterized protein with HEPN domain